MKKEQRGMSDKELDDFFRKKAQNPEIPFHQTDWKLMKEKLDRQDPSGNGNSRGGGYSGWIIALFALVLVTGGGLWWYNLTGHQENATEQLDTPLPNSLKLPPNEDSLNKGAIQGMANRQAIESPPGPEKPNAGVNSGKNSEDGPVIRGSANLAGDVYPHNREISSLVTQERTRPIEGAALDERTVGLGNQFTGKLSEVMTEINVLLTDSAEKKREGSSLALESNTDISRIRDKKFSLALSIAPDVSALKLKDIVGMGTSIGLNLEYFLHPNFSLNAGAMYAFKTYKGGEGYYTGYVPSPSGILGDCWMLDLPLNVRYYAINSGLSRWYISAGTTSYIMIKEKYDLEYVYSSGKAYERRVEIKNGSRHYFAIINLSVGFERVLSDKLAIQVEPYYKLPMKGIGEGKINLKSAGALIGLKYNW